MHIVLTRRTDDHALCRSSHRSEKGSSLIVTSHNDPLRAAPQKKGGTAAGTTWKIVQALEANDDLTPASQRERQCDERQVSLQRSGSLPHWQTRLKLHDDRVEA